jgi:uncharacterized membrane protein YbhN (UPF0104 family)
MIFLLALTLQFSVVEASWNQFKSYGKAAGDISSSNQNTYIILAVILLAAIAGFWFFKSKMQNAIFIIKKIIGGVWEGLISATKLKKHNLFFFYSFAIWFLYLLATYVGLYATEGTESSFQTAISCLAFASIGMIITPGGIGAYAYFMAKVLELNGVDYTLGLANGTLQWFSQFIIILVLGGIALIILPLFNKQKI